MTNGSFLCSTIADGATLSSTQTRSATITCFWTTASSPRPSSSPSSIRNSSTSVAGKAVDSRPQETATNDVNETDRNDAAAAATNITTAKDPRRSRRRGTSVIDQTTAAAATTPKSRVDAKKFPSMFRSAKAVLRRLPAVLTPSPSSSSTSAMTTLRMSRYPQTRPKLSLKLLLLVRTTSVLSAEFSRPVFSCRCLRSTTS